MYVFPSQVDADPNPCLPQRWSSTFQHTASYHAHAGMILSSISIASSRVLVTGAGDSSVKIWEVDSASNRGRKPVRGSALGLDHGEEEAETGLEAEGADGTSLDWV
jgi:hypothetical protein